MRLKMAVVEPIPSASARTAVIRNPRSFSRVRTPNFVSCQSQFMEDTTQTKRSHMLRRSSLLRTECHFAR